MEQKHLSHLRMFKRTGSAQLQIMQNNDVKGSSSAIRMHAHFELNTCRMIAKMANWCLFVPLLVTYAYSILSHGLSQLTGVL